VSVVDHTKTSWFEKAESEIRTLKDVESVSIQGESDIIQEIHVLTRSNRPPKHIVRDIQSVMLNRFKRSIDYRVVSVAYLSAETTTAATDRGSGNGVASGPTSEPAAPPLEEAPRPTVAKVVQAPTPPITSERPAALDERIRFAGVNLYVSGPRTQAQVELVWRGLPRMGTASGWSTRSGAHRLVAQATLVAVQEFLAEELALGLLDVEFLRLGKKRAVVVSLSMLVERQEKLLVGTCVIEQDLHQAVVFATLAALNRLVGGLRPKESTEYVLRPTSVE